MECLSADKGRGRTCKSLLHRVGDQDSGDLHEELSSCADENIHPSDCKLVFQRNQEESEDEVDNWSDINGLV